MATLTIKDVNKVMGLLDSIRTEDNDKLNYAIKKNMTAIQSAIAPKQKDFNEKLEDARIKYASTYPKDFEDVSKRGLLITNDKGSFSYTPEATQSFNDEVRPIQKAFDEGTIDFAAYEAQSGAGWERVDTLDLFVKDELKDVLFGGKFNLDTEAKIAPVAQMNVISENLPSDPAPQEEVAETVQE